MHEDPRLTAARKKPLTGGEEAILFLLTAAMFAGYRFEKGTSKNGRAPSIDVDAALEETALHRLGAPQEHELAWETFYLRPVAQKLLSLLRTEVHGEIAAEAKMLAKMRREFAALCYKQVDSAHNPEFFVESGKREERAADTRGGYAARYWRRSMEESGDE
jgi:hypothetical protein